MPESVRPFPPQFVYLCFGKSPGLRRELAYSVATLLVEIGGDASRIAVFTDQPQDFAAWPVKVVDISDRLKAMQWTGDGHFHLRAKPAALAEALRLFRRDCVLLDTDSFVHPGFAVAVERALAAGGAMNAFVRSCAYSFFGPFETDLPRVGRYRFDPVSAPMLNSGLVAVRPEHLDVIEDSVTLTDRLWVAGLHQHDTEQFAIGECFRFAGVEVALIDREFHHYCQRWAKRYMRRRLRRRLPSAIAAPVAARPDVPLSKTRVRLFKWRKLARLGLRRLRRRVAATWLSGDAAKELRT